MLYRVFLTVCAILATAALSGCGGAGSDGLNGALAMTAQVEGISVTGNVAYTNPQKSDLIGTEISLTTDRPDLFGGGRTLHTNNSGSVNFLFQPQVIFDKEQTFSVIATTGNLQAFVANLKMTGRTISMTPPGTKEITVASTDASTTKTISLDTNLFVTVRDPFNQDVADHLITITASLVQSSGSGGVLTAPANSTTVSNGTAPLAGATLTINVPAPGNTNTATIIWTATDTVTNLVTSGITSVSITKQ